MSIPFPLRKQQRETLVFLHFESPQHHASRGTTRGNRSWHAYDGSGGKIKIHGHTINVLLERGLLEREFDAEASIPLMKAKLTEEGHRIAKELRAEKTRAKKRGPKEKKSRGPGRLSLSWHRRFDRRIVRQYDGGKGMSVQELAHEYNVHVRTIRRILRKAKVMKPRKPWPEHLKDYHKMKRASQEEGKSVSVNTPAKSKAKPTRAYEVLNFMRLNPSAKIVSDGEGRVTFENERLQRRFLQRFIEDGYVERILSNEEGWEHYQISDAGREAVRLAAEKRTYRIPRPSA